MNATPAFKLHISRKNVSTFNLLKIAYEYINHNKISLQEKTRNEITAQFERLRYNYDCIIYYTYIVKNYADKWNKYILFQGILNWLWIFLIENLSRVINLLPTEIREQNRLKRELNKIPELNKTQQMSSLFTIRDEMNSILNNSCYKEFVKKDKIIKYVEFFGEYKDWLCYVLNDKFNGEYIHFRHLGDALVDENDNPFWTETETRQKIVNEYISKFQQLHNQNKAEELLKKFQEMCEIMDFTDYVDDYKEEMDTLKISNYINKQIINKIWN